MPTRSETSSTSSATRLEKPAPAVTDRQGRARRGASIQLVNRRENGRRAKIWASAGNTVNAGQDVRLVNIPSDASAGLGAFQELHGFKDGAALSAQLTRAAEISAYVIAARAFLDRLASDRAADPNVLTTYISARRQAFLDKVLKTSADGQVISVATAFQPDRRRRGDGNPVRYPVMARERSIRRGGDGVQGVASRARRHWCGRGLASRPDRPMFP